MCSIYDIYVEVNNLWRISPQNQKKVVKIIKKKNVKTRKYKWKDKLLRTKMSVMIFATLGQ